MTKTSATAIAESIAPALNKAERRAETNLAMLRLVSLVVLTWTTRGVDSDAGHHAMLLSLGAYCVLAVAGIIIAFAGFYRSWLPWLMSSGEVILLLHCLVVYGWMLDLPIANALAMPGSALVYLYLAQAAVRRQPALVLYIGGVFIVGWLLLYVLWQGDMQARAPVIAEGRTDIAVRLALVGLAASVLAVAVLRGRRELVDSIVHGRVRRTLARFVPERLVASLEKEFSAHRGLRKAEAAVLFVDLRNFTAYSEHAPLDQVVALLTEFRRRVTAQVKAHGGYVDKFIGDAVMIVFSGSSPSPDDGQRALACSTTLADELAAWLRDRRQPSEALHFGITLHYGIVACGVISGGGREEYTVLGDTVNVAARMQEVASEYRQSLVVSADALAAAKIAASARKAWVALPTQTMRGRLGTLELFHSPVGQPREPSR